MLEVVITSIDRCSNMWYNLLGSGAHFVAKIIGNETMVNLMDGVGNIPRQQ